MAVLVVAREMLVTAIRAFFEEGGTDFSAKWAGKWKMLFQCLAVVLSLYLQDPQIVARYAHPKYLWAMVPLILFWIMRIWFSN